MSVTQIIQEIDRLPETEQRRIADHLRQHLPQEGSETSHARDAVAAGAAQYVDRKRARELADEVFRVNAELFRKLAQ